MKEYKIELEVDDKGNIIAETFGMQGKVCAEELDSILKDIDGHREIHNTPDYSKSQQNKQITKQKLTNRR